jgi:hypothetical protein
MFNACNDPQNLEKGKWKLRISRTQREGSQKKERKEGGRRQKESGEAWDKKVARGEYIVTSITHRCDGAVARA